MNWYLWTLVVAGAVLSIVSFIRARRIEKLRQSFGRRPD